MSGMKNLALALDELHEAEARALAAGGWVSVIVGNKTLWKRPRTDEMHSQEDAARILRSNWAGKLED